MKAKIFGILALVLVAITTLAVFAVADTWTESGKSNIREMKVYVEGVNTWDGNCNYDATTNTTNCTTTQSRVPALERGEQMSVKVVFIANNDLPKTEVKAWLSGYHEDIEDRTGKFDVFAGNTYTRTLYLDIPNNLDAKETYTLYVKIQGRTELSGVDEAKINTVVQRQVSNLEILSVELYGDSKFYKGVCGECTEKFQAGKICACTNGQLYADIVLKNRGHYDLEDLYVKVKVEGTCIERTVYVGDLGASDKSNDDTKKVTIGLELPEDMKSGTYTLSIKAYNDEKSVSTTKTFIVEQVQAEAPTIVRKIEVLPQITRVDVEQGKGSVYSITVTNLGSEREDIIIEVLGTEGWATTQVNPAAFSLAKDESKQVFIYLNTNEDAVLAEHIFTVRVRYGDEMKQLNLTANVAEAKEAKVLDLKSILLIVGIILAVVIVVLLIILLATKGQGRAEEKPEESYY